MKFNVVALPFYLNILLLIPSFRVYYSVLCSWNWFSYHSSSVVNLFSLLPATIIVGAKTKAGVNSSIYRTISKDQAEGGGAITTNIMGWIDLFWNSFLLRRTDKSVFNVFPLSNFNRCISRLLYVDVCKLRTTLSFAFISFSVSALLSIYRRIDRYIETPSAFIWFLSGYLSLVISRIQISTYG